MEIFNFKKSCVTYKKVRRNYEKTALLGVLLSLSMISFSEELDNVQDVEIRADKSVEESIQKDYDQDGKYSSYEKALRKAQKSIYVTLPERRGYWYTILDRVKSEEDELVPEAKARLRKRR